jgi:GT2 family glycosyltransferase
MARLQPPASRRNGGLPRKSSGRVPPVAPRATLTFRGTTARITLNPPIAPDGVLYDTAPLPADRWRITPDGLEVACPPTAFDASPHVLRLAWPDQGLPSLDLPFRSDYRGAIDEVTDRGLRGWLHDALRPDSPIALDVVCGAVTCRIHNTLPRPDSAEGGGFELALPPRPAASSPELVTITVEGTTCQPFGPILRGTLLPAVLAAATAAGRALGRGPVGRLFGTTVLPALVGRGVFPAPADAVELRGTQFLTRPGVPEIDVIVPVHGGRTETLACLASVLDAGNQVRHRLVVIDDATPDPALRAALDALAAAGRIHLLRNARTLGFVASVNRGMALSSTADVLLLNADTLVPPGFLDRLYRAAYADVAIATATPLSNNATAYSLPAPPGDPADPWGLPYQEIDALCRAENAGIVRDIPTAHGFCMFIKRAALQDVGLFDEATFGTGYGEENDFSLRALLRGWRNVCAAEVYVHHIGRVSFGAAAGSDVQLAANLRTLAERYPFYPAAIADFLRTDPLHDLRNNIQKALWRRHPRIAVVITLSLDGGAARHAADLMARLAAEGWLALALTAERDADGLDHLALRRPGGAEALRYPAGVPQEAAFADILDLAPRFLHVQHVIDLPEGVAAFVRDCGIPYAVTLHDFFYACPRVTLLDAGSRYCGMPPVAKCTLCIRQGPIHPQIHPSLARHAERGETWRALWEPFLREAAQIIAPSEDTAARYVHLFPGLPVTVRPHFAPPGLQAAPAPAPPSDRLRVALPGAIGPQKGALVLSDLVRHCSRWHDDIDFVLVGYSDRDDELKRYDNVIRRGGYRPDGAVAALAAAGCHVALLLNVFPETFSYTLSESILAGLVPVAFDFGAIGERMRTLGTGIALPPGAPPEQIVAALREAARQRADLPAAAVFGTYPALVGDYYAPALVDLMESTPPPDLPQLVGLPRGLDHDRWCAGTLRLRLWARMRPEQIAFDLWVPAEARLQAVEIACNNTTLTRGFIEPDGVRCVVCTLPQGRERLLDITCTFDFVFPLAAPDVRSCAAMLSRLRVGSGGRWLDVPLPRPPAPIAGGFPLAGA